MLLILRNVCAGNEAHFIYSLIKSRSEVQSTQGNQSTVQSKVRFAEQTIIPVCTHYYYLIILAFLYDKFFLSHKIASLSFSVLYVSTGIET